MKTIIATAALVVTASAAMADPNIDMSEIRLNDGKLDFDVNSYAAAGAQIQGTTGGTISATVGASNQAWGYGEGEFEVFLETDNAGPGVGGFGSVESSAGFTTGVEGSAWADTTGAGDSNTVASTFGEAGIGFDGTFNVDLQSDDWN